MNPLESAVTIFFLLPIYMWCVIRVVWWMFEGEIDVLPGIVSVVMLIVGLCFASGTANDFARWACVVCSISLVVMFPFASHYLDRFDLREINAEQVDRAFLELSLRPDNFSAWFKLSQGLFDMGYHGHAIALAEQTIARIPTESDPMQNRSMRDLFRSEEAMIRQWRSIATDPRRHRPVPCPKCGAMNQPGTVNCIKCGIPYLLLLSRRIGTRSGAFTRLVIGWAIISAIIPLAAYWGVSAPNSTAGMLGFVAGFGVLAGVLYWVFRDPTGQPGRFQSFS